MKRLLVLSLLGLFSAAMVGCEARGRVGDPDRTTTGTSYERRTTTTTIPPSDTRTRTEVEVERR
jgi:hypothetical protein